MTLDDQTMITAALTYLIAPSGSGALASWIFARLRQVCPLPRHDPGLPWRWGYQVLFVPRYAALSAPALAYAIALLVAWPLAVITDQHYWTLAWGNILAPVINQLVYGLQRSKEIQYPDA
jgi:hypothetical protein